MEKKEQLFRSALVKLLKGVVNNNDKEQLWLTILENKTEIEEYFSKLGLTLIIHKEDGYAYLKQQSLENEEKSIPKLIYRRQLDFLTSFAIVLLKKETIELQKNNSDKRYILSKNAFFDKIKPYLKITSDEVKQKKEFDTIINKLKEMGFIRFLNNNDSNFEILPLVKGFVDAQLVSNIDEKLNEYIQYGSKKVSSESEGE